MELPLITQAVTLLKNSTTPLIIIPKEPSTDALSAALGLLAILEKTKKSVRIVSPGFTLPPDHSFLPKSDAVHHDLSSLQNFIITVDVAKTKLESLSYDLRDNQLHIYLAPKNGFFEPANIKTSAGVYAYDLIITLDLADLEGLGQLHKDNAEFFYRTPILNIDHHPANTRFGHVNLVDVTASAVSETVFEIIKELAPDALDEQVATSLLAGIISKTKVFQSQSVTPRSLAIASHLMAAGGRRDEIIRHLYQTKNLPTLRVWGRALANLTSADNGRIVWSVVTATDLAASQAKPADAAGVLDELMINAPASTYTILFVAVDGGTNVYLNHRPEATLPELPSQLVRQTPQYILGHLSGQPETVAEEIVAKLRRP